MTRKSSPISPFLNKRGFCILDGGLATELEYQGHDLNHPLWSAKVMLENPKAISDIHKSYLEAGADCIISASYQISFDGCSDIGMSPRQTRDLLEKTINVASEARSSFLKENNNSPDARFYPLIAASIGPYGAYLANGSEYTGDYNVTDERLYNFHFHRWEILSDSPADFMAIETIPSYNEARVLKRLIEQSPGKSAYISFSCKDDLHISDGTPIKDCAALFEGSTNVFAVGINCTAPSHIVSLIKNVRAGAPDKDVVVYPNSGEVYNGQSRSWIGDCTTTDFADLAMEWFDAGARIIGGCCRTRPAHIKVLREQLASHVL